MAPAPEGGYDNCGVKRLFAMQGMESRPALRTIVYHFVMFSSYIKPAQILIFRYCTHISKAITLHMEKQNETNATNGKQKYHINNIIVSKHCPSMGTRL